MNKVLHHSKLFVQRNASTILTCAGGVGLVTTTVLAVKATPKAMALLEEAKAEKGEKLTKMETVYVAAPAYLPATLVGIGTLACIFGANVLNKRQQAALMSAYALIDGSYKEYKNKVDELYGEEADNHVKAEIAKDKYDACENKPSEGKQLFYDEFSGRYFESTIEDVQRAEYRLNRHLVMRDYAYLNEFYDMVGLSDIDAGYTLGWSMGACMDRYWQSWIDFTHEKTIIDDDLECYIIVMEQEPIPNFEDYC